MRGCFCTWSLPQLVLGDRHSADEVNGSPTKQILKVEGYSWQSWRISWFQARWIDTTRFNVFCMIFFLKPTTPLVCHQCDDSALDRLQCYGRALWRPCHKFGEIPCKWQAGRDVALIIHKVQPIDEIVDSPELSTDSTKHDFRDIICSSFLGAYPQVVEEHQEPARICWSVATWFQIWSWPNSMKMAKQLVDIFRIFFRLVFTCFLPSLYPRGSKATRAEVTVQRLPQKPEKWIWKFMSVYLDFNIKTPERPTT